MLETVSPSKTFSGVRFVLIGFNPIDESKLRSKLVNGGAVDVGQYSQNCTHVIVGKLLYDDPICVAARNSGKTVVMGSWVDHSFDIGMPVDPTSVLYRPPKDLNGIPGAQSLIVCLTGYQRQDRDDIMTMVALMGAQVSKPLVANRVTHLVCYKFEGEKYELAKRMNRIKLVNHRWLEDCLRDWKLLPEADYEKSGYELEMMEASARDSEDEAEDASVQRSAGRNINKSPLGLRVGISVGGDMPKLVEPEMPVIQTNSGMPRDSSNQDTSKDVWLTPRKVNRHREALASDVINHPQQPYCEKTSTFQDASCNVFPDPLDKTPESTKVENDLMSISKSAERFSHSAMKLSSLSYSRRTLKQSPRTKCLGEALSSVSGSPRLTVGGLEATTADFCASKAESALERTSLLEDPHKIDKSHGEEFPKILPQKRSIDGSVSSSKSPKVGNPNEASGALPASFSVQELEPGSPEQKHALSIGDPTESGKVAQKLPASVTTTKSPSSNETPMKDAIPTLENMTSKTAPDEIVGKKTPERSLAEPVIGNSSVVSCLSLPEGKDKPAAEQPKKKTASRKTLGTRNKVKSTGNQKGSIYLSNTASSNDCTSGGKVAAPIQENDNQTEISNPVVDFEAMQEMTKRIEGEIEASKKNDSAEDDTNASEGKDCHEADKAVNQDTLDDTDIAYKDLQVEAKLGEPELKDSSNKDSPDDAIVLEVDKNESEQTKEAASGEMFGLDKGKKRDLPTVKPGKLNVKKTKKSKKDILQDENLKGNDTGANDMEGKTKEEKENLPLSGEEKKSNLGKALARNEAAKSAKTPAKAGKTSGQISSKSMIGRKVLHDLGKEPKWFIFSGHRLQRKEYQQMIRRLKGKCCRDSHQWSYQATHFVAAEIRRTEKFFAAAASGSWILKSDYVAACSQAGKFLAEEPYEWHKIGLSEDGAINLEAPRKWRLLREKTGHGAFYGMRIVIYGDCIVPSLDTIKRAVKAGDGTILATSPPYTRFLNSNTDFAVVSPGMPRVDVWIQEFQRHEIPCVVADYLVEYVCKPGYALDKHVLYNTNAWAERSFNRLRCSAEEVAEEGLASPADSSEGDDVACEVCGSRERGEVMLICGDEKGSTGCGIGTHIDCCEPPLTEVPKDDCFCPKCSVNRNHTENPSKKANKGKVPSSRR